MCIEKKLERRMEGRSSRPAAKEGKPMCYQCRREYVGEEGDVCNTCDRLIDEQVTEILCRLEGFRPRPRK